MSSHLDSAVTRSQLAAVNDHLQQCAECAEHYASTQQTQSLVASLGRKTAPPDLALRLRVALSQELANAQRPRWESLRVHWENAFNAVMVPATFGVVTTLIIFGVLISVLYPSQLTAANDVPTMLYTPPQLQCRRSSCRWELPVPSPDRRGLCRPRRPGAGLSRPLGRRQRAGDPAGTEEHADLYHFPVRRPPSDSPPAGRVVLSFSKVQVKG